MSSLLAQPYVTPKDCDTVEIQLKKEVLMRKRAPSRTSSDDSKARQLLVKKYLRRKSMMVA
jgi:hypothetical protein